MWCEYFADSVDTISATGKASANFTMWLMLVAIVMTGSRNEVLIRRSRRLLFFDRLAGLGPHLILMRQKPNGSFDRLRWCGQLTHRVQQLA